MKEKLVLIMLLLVVFALPAYAENPFVDVAEEHWAYTAIDKLADEGIINGYPDGAYKGNKVMTRYEMANLIGRAIALCESEDEKISAENKACIAQLAQEFSQELQSLGVRVSALEEKVGNVKLNGDARLRYQHFDNDQLKPDKSRYQLRVRLRATAKVNDNVKAVVRFTTGNMNLEADDGGAVDAKMDHYYVSYNNKNLNGQVGAFWVGLGDVANNGYPTLVDAEILGTQLNWDISPNTKLTLLSGRISDDYTGSTYYNNTVFNDVNLYAGEIRTDLKKLSLVADYMQHEAKSNSNMFGLTEDKMSIWSVGANYKFTDKVSAFAQYWKSDWDVLKSSTGKEVDQDSFLVGLNANLHPRTNMQLLYGQLGGASMISGLSTYSTGLEQPVFLKVDDKADMWKVGLYYRLMKGVVWDLEYFNVSGDVDNTKKDGEYIQTRLNFKF